MSDKSGISWCDATWQVVAGCSPASPGCARCYSARLLATRHRHLPWARGLATFDDSGEGERRAHWTGEVHCRRDQLSWPLRKRRTLRIFVGDRGDLFHVSVPDAYLDEVFSVVARCPQHTFMVLTKRPQRMRHYMEGIERGANECGGEFPWSNVWLGTSIEDQRRADERVPELLATPAAHRFLSIEPMLGPIDLSAYLGGPYVALPGDVVAPGYNHGIAQVIVGGESGPGAREFHIEWAENIIEQCRAASVPCYLKQLGAAPRYIGGVVRFGSRSGADPSEWPAELRVRELAW